MGDYRDSFIWLLTVVTSDALPVGPGRVGNNDGGPHRFAQPHQIVGQRLAAIKTLNFTFQCAQLAYRTRQAAGRAHQPDIISHDILQSAHVPADQGRVGRAILCVTPCRNVGMVVEVDSLRLSPPNLRNACALTVLR